MDVSMMAGLDEPGGPGGPGSPEQPGGPGGPGTQRSSSALLEREEQLAEPGDHERFAHYVEKSKITASAVSGDPVIALCGKVWVPGRDPSKFPVCPECKEIYALIKK